MGSSNFHLITLAVGIALSPMPVIAMMVLCGTGRARRCGSLFLAGWYLSILIFMILSVFLFNDWHQKSPEELGLFDVIFRCLAAVLFFYLAWKNWSTRTHRMEQTHIPKWIENFEKKSSKKMFMQGVTMNFINLKNIPLMINAALYIAKISHSAPQGIGRAAFFGLLASIPLLIPWVTAMLGNMPTHRRLRKLTLWLYRHSNIIMAVFLLLIALNLTSSSFLAIKAMTAASG